jgi:hypothetical protein
MMNNPLKWILLWLGLACAALHRIAIQWAPSMLLCWPATA